MSGDGPNPVPELAGFNEAPIRESGKWRNATQIFRFGQASMRPRFANRGSTRGNACDSGSPIRFNEAPIRESGKSRNQRARIHRWRCFNEAPIRESGKCDPQDQPRIGTAGFNEAPIRESGKCLNLTDWGGKVYGFNEAPIRESGKWLEPGVLYYGWAGLQ